MAEEGYSVRINRRDGVVEITGADKEWVATQLERLTSVLAAEPASEVPPGSDADGGAGTGRPRRRSATAARKPKDSPTSAVETKLVGEMHKKLEEFVAERSDHFKSRQDQAAIIATFLEDQLGFEGIDQNDLAKVYEIMGWRAPVNPRAVINNARDRQKYFRGWVNGRTKLSVGGQNFGRHDSKVSATEASEG